MLLHTFECVLANPERALPEEANQIFRALNGAIDDSLGSADSVFGGFGQEAERGRQFGIKVFRLALHFIGHIVESVGDGFRFGIALTPRIVGCQSAQFGPAFKLVDAHLKRDAQPVEVFERRCIQRGHVLAASTVSGDKALEALNLVANAELLLLQFGDIARKQSAERDEAVPRAAMIRALAEIAGREFIDVVDYRFAPSVEVSYGCPERAVAIVDPCDFSVTFFA